MRRSRPSSKKVERPVVSSTVELEFDKETGEYYVAWRPAFAGAGGTGRDALEDLRAAAHFGVDVMIDTQLKQLNKED
jgi:hypothetical protein